METIFIKFAMALRQEPEWHATLRQRGGRVTEPRKVILDTLRRTKEHLSAEEVFRRVHRRHPGVGLTTVYRTLDVLEKMGLIARLHFGDGRSRYELVQSPHKPGHHHHLVCTRCNRVIDYDDLVEEEVKLFAQVEQALSARHHFRITGHVIQFYGLCAFCRKKE